MVDQSLNGSAEDARRARFAEWWHSKNLGLTYWEREYEAYRAAEQRILDMLGSEEVAEALAKVLDPNCFIGTEKEIHRYCSPRLVSYCQDQVKHTAKAALAAIKGRIGG